MASSKATATWAELQESFTRVRKQYGLLPQAEWEPLLAVTVQDNAATSKQRKETTSIPPLPSIRQDVSKSNAQIRKGNKHRSEGFLRNRHDREWKLELPPLPAAKRMETQKGNFFVLKTSLEKKKYQHWNIKEHELFNYFSENQTFALTFLDTFMSEILLSEIIPDVLMEALTNNATQIRVHPQNSYDKATRKEQKTENAVLDLFSKSLFNELLLEVVNDLSVNVIRKTMRDFVEDHILNSAVNQFTDEMIISIIQMELPTVIQEIKDEIYLDDIHQYLINDVVDKEVKSTIHTIFVEHEDERSVLQENQITASANKYLIDTFLLEHLVGLIGTQTLIAFDKDVSLCLLDSMMLDIMLRQHLRIQHGQQVTLENHSMKILHQKAVSGMALEVILTELKMLMDEDMEDVFEYEKDMELGS
ncbi:Hypothetical predicted protein [Pelobates cultripes]|uniref:Uncharacterized protein n=2 Tax=Pelobates cultripes TaxID=61616 RepID=A0AAD1T6Q4_PELCU|nr:Hypothetical predicted protein [Pelobates cultripes]